MKKAKTRLSPFRKEKIISIDRRTFLKSPIATSLALNLPAMAA